MDSLKTGDLVTIVGPGPDLDGIVFDIPSRTKVVVAVVVAGRGPAFRTVHPDTLTERTEAGPNDAAMRSLMRRTPAPTGGSSRGGSTAGRSSAGFSRGASHRTTGK